MISREIEKLIYVSLIVILSIIFIFIGKGANEFVMGASLILFYIYFFRSVSRPLNVTGGISTFMKIDVFFMLFYYMIYYYPYQLYLLGLYDLHEQMWSYFTYVEYSNRAMIMSNIGLVSFMFGFSTKKYDKQEAIKMNGRLLSRLSIIFALLMLLITVLFVISGGVLMFVGVYAGSDTGDITSNAIFSLVSFFYILGGIHSIYVYYKTKKTPLISWVIILAVAIWCFLLLFLGDRNTFFILAIALSGGVFTFLRGIKRITIVFFVFIGMFLYNVVEVSRSLDDKSIDNVIESFTDSNQSEKNDYGANSFNTTTIGCRASLAIVPEKKDFFYGKFKLVSLTSLVPYSSRLFFDDSDVLLGSSAVLTDEMIGLTADWGVGTNILSDCYMDFGLIGVIFFMIVLGFYGGYIKNTLLRNPENIKTFFLYIIIMAYYSEIARYGIDFPLRSIVWTILIFNFIRLNQRKK